MTGEMKSGEQSHETPHQSRPSARCVLAVVGVCCIGMAVRIGVSFGGYSGHNKPPMYGDFEAQRHWMEITTGLPPPQWYFNGTNNDLGYWGLDYPPLTAYHSWLCGKVAAAINPGWMALGDSHGVESEGLKLYMRNTALLADVLVYMTAAICWVLWRRSTRAEPPGKDGRDGTASCIAAAIPLILHPCFILIDHGHFQYNSVSLGFALWAILLLANNRYIFGSIFFMLSLGYKQMSLYYAPIFFFFLLSRAIYATKKPWLNRMAVLAAIGASVILSFCVIFLPFLFDINQLLQVLHRMFPFARGLFEDKVANFWCIFDVIFKFKQSFTVPQLLNASLLATLGAITPACIKVFLQPTVQNFIYGLIACSFAFFLFSFQVHEKSILLVALPVALVDGRTHGLIKLLFMTASTFSLFPLLEKDAQALGYVSSILLALLAYFVAVVDFRSWKMWHSVIFVLHMCAIGAVHGLHAWVEPPTLLPHLWVLANCAYAFAIYAITLAYFYSALLFNRDGASDQLAAKRIQSVKGDRKEKKS